MAAAAIHPRTPVIIGVAQINGKGRELPSAEPLVTWQAVAQQAVRDAGLNADVLSALNAVLLSDCMTWRYDDPPRGLAERLGARLPISSQASQAAHRGKAS